MKKIIIAITSLLLGAAILTGCSFDISGHVDSEKITDSESEETSVVEPEHSSSSRNPITPPNI